MHSRVLDLADGVCWMQFVPDPAVKYRMICKPCHAQSLTEPGRCFFLWFLFFDMSNSGKMDGQFFFFSHVPVALSGRLVGVINKTICLLFTQLGTYNDSSHAVRTRLHYKKG